MHPILLDFGWHEIPLLGRTHLFLPSYGVLFAAGVLIAWWWFLRRARALGINEEKVFNLGFYGLLGGIVGAKATLIAVEWRTYAEHPWEILGSVRSAGVLMGGVLAGSAAFALYARRNQLPLFRLADAAAGDLGENARAMFGVSEPVARLWGGQARAVTVLPDDRKSSMAARTSCTCPQSAPAACGMRTIAFTRPSRLALRMASRVCRSVIGRRTSWLKTSAGSTSGMGARMGR